MEHVTDIVRVLEEMAVVWVIASFSQNFTNARPDDGGNKYPRKFAKLLPRVNNYFFTYCRDNLKSH